ncbi:MAG: type II toxin-antitoxin system RelE/ParE family toxin [Cellvibrio sp.]|uniref:type II toxin-antitoxin system RelE/ParE family toxin n=1 Tax=Cellvibrio sp. TaxID=1965322 RepID=UPI002722F6A5|nr:type II toxin-antitoxin system RelE/ParE family toxin [Cellvibrio sp.]
MDYQLSVRKEAETDIAEAFDYYESCRKSLGHDFLLAVEASLNKIQRNPVLYKEIHRQIRRVFINRFPYGIYFVIMGNTVIVIGVIHARKNPRHWKKHQ